MSSEYTLVIDAATARGSVALLRGLELVSSRDVLMRADDEERLMPAVAACCDDAALSPRDLARVVCGEGPGSFTSLRIAGSIAKGIATATGCPLFAVSSLLLSVAAVSQKLPAGSYLSVLDAYRGELFALPVRLTDGEVRDAGALTIVAQDGIAAHARALGARIVGPEQEVDSWPHATGAAALLPQTVAAGPVDLVAWEPVYGRAPEAQVRWERAHGRALPA